MVVTGGERLCEGFECLSEGRVEGESWLEDLRRSLELVWFGEVVGKKKEIARWRHTLLCLKPAASTWGRLGS